MTASSPGTLDDATVDTNILIYAIDASQGQKHVRARRLVDTLAEKNCILPLQALNEFFFVCVRKKIVNAGIAEAYIQALLRSMQVISPTQEDLRQAMQLHREHGQQFFDALLLSTAARAGCRIFFSEDLQHGRTFSSMQVIDPFAMDAAAFGQLLV